MKKLWIGSGIVVGVCLLAIVLSTVFRSGPDPLRVSTEASTHFAASVQEIPLVVSNLTDTKTGFVRRFELQQEKNGSFTALPGTDGEGDEAFVNAQDATRVMVGLEPFGTLEPGRYRFCLRGADGKKYFSNIFFLDDAVIDAVGNGTLGEELLSSDDIRTALRTATLSASVEIGGEYVCVDFDNYLSSQVLSCRAEVGLQRLEENSTVWVIHQASVQEVSFDTPSASFYCPLTGTEKEGTYRAYLWEQATGTYLYSDTFSL